MCGLLVSKLTFICSLHGMIAMEIIGKGYAMLYEAYGNGIGMFEYYDGMSPGSV